MRVWSLSIQFKLIGGSDDVSYPGGTINPKAITILLCFSILERPYENRIRDRMSRVAVVRLMRFCVSIIY